MLDDQMSCRHGVYFSRSQYSQERRHCDTINVKVIERCEECMYTHNSSFDANPVQQYGAVKGT